MPELPEVETVRRQLEASVLGRIVVRLTIFRSDLRFPVDEQALYSLEGRRFVGFRRRGKYLICEFSGDASMIVHLGMSGKLLLCDTAERNKHDHVLFDLDDGHQLRFRDPRRFGALFVAASTEVDRHPFLRELGVEPLGPKFTPDVLADLLGRSSRPVKTLLLDQTKIAGIGNIYANEILFRAGIHPQRSANDLDREEIRRLHAAILGTLRAAIERGGTTVRDYRNAADQKGWFQLELAVYHRAGQPCPRCQAQVESIRLGGRSTFFCPHCQPAIRCRRGRSHDISPSDERTGKQSASRKQ